MNRLKVQKYLTDIQEACSLIHEFTLGRTFEEYYADIMRRSAVERQFAIVGEALSQMLRLAPELADRITESARIIGFRNQLIHGYGRIADDVVWLVVEEYLPALRQEIEQLLAEI